MGALTLEDIQGNILRGYGFPRAAYLFFEVPTAAAGRRFLGELVDRVQTAVAWEKGSAPATATNVAITCQGLRALGLPAAIIDTLSPAFREPIRQRAARLLDDTGPSAPDRWDEGIGSDRSHILVAINAREGCEVELDAEMAAVRSSAEADGLRLVHQQDATALPHRREHFGWADGFGQPSIEGTETKPGGGTPTKGGGWGDLKAGEFLHGYPDEDAQTTSGPAADVLRNGTYMVYRKLYQDIVRFRVQLHEDGLRYGACRGDEPPLSSDELYELMAAKVVGRWRDGFPAELERPAGAPTTKLGDEALPDPPNDFRYQSSGPGAPNDGDGYRCPKGAHIRRTNPRDALGFEGEMARRHRIIRRGMPYGDFLPSAVLEDDGKDRGLIFVCFNASLERQFEVIQRQWCNDGNAFGLGNEKDYLLSDTGITGQGTGVTPVSAADGRISAGRVTIQGEPPHYVEARPPVVATKGCEYLLMPGIEALRDLARGRWDD